VFGAPLPVCAAFGGVVSAVTAGLAAGGTIAIPLGMIVLPPVLPEPGADAPPPAGGMVVAFAIFTVGFVAAGFAPPPAMATQGPAAPPGVFDAAAEVPGGQLTVA
jgi:hypothetical protein